MKHQIKQDDHRLQIFHEGRKRRLFVGELIYDKQSSRFILTYDKRYARSKKAIPLGPGLDLFTLRHESEQNKLFPLLEDRIPEKSNPAYIDYCKSQGISINEKNPIILLGTIGRRGPSSFVFELVHDEEFDPVEIVSFRKKLDITQHDLAQAFDVKKSTLQRIEAGVSRDMNTLKRLEILLKFPDVAIWQLKKTGNLVHRDVLNKLLNYFKNDRSGNFGGP